ncbi:MAG: hypothetical protein IPH20_03655 [Bacteroidales bacterium]|nr:hypothetical protein [Bacteroidales bacterium]
MKNLVLSIMILISGVITAQECHVDLYALAQPDINMKQLNKFGQNRFKKIVLSDGFDTTAHKDIVNQLSQWFLNQDSGISIVNVSDVKKPEDSCHYLIIGLANNSDDLSIFDLPIKINNNICTLGTIELSDYGDAISVINESANCTAIIGNSYEALRNISSGRFLGLYDYYILKDFKMSYLGNLEGNKFGSDRLVDLELIRNENYAQKIDNKYLEACFSCKYNTIGQFQASIDALIDSFDDFCRIYKVKRPSQKLKFFIHSDQLEINIVSGDPKPGSTGGFVTDSLIHTVGLDADLLTHEGVHFIFNSNISCPNAFFREGIPLSFALFQHPERITNDCKLIQDHLGITDLITGKTGFWNGPYENGQCLSYPISGLFVKFLIDKYGIEKLKKFYQYPDAAEGCKDVYNAELPVIIAEWKDYVLKNVE